VKRYIGSCFLSRASIMSSKKSSKSGRAPQQDSGLKMSRRSFMKAGAAGAAVVGIGLAVKPRSASLATTQGSSTTSTDAMAPLNITLNVNNKNYNVQVEPRDMLVNVIRENIGLIGTKRPCNRMECGGCTVLIDNIPYYSCTGPPDSHCRR
jgi:xanthine dehydrogenase YagT iron-sulfur-binding subunit